MMLGDLEDSKHNITNTSFNFNDNIYNEYE